MNKEYYFKGKFVVTNTDIEVEFTITSEVKDEEYVYYKESDNMAKDVVCYAIEFANEYGFEMPFDYLCDWMHPCFDKEEECKEVYVYYIDSNLIDEESFDVMWDNYMKAFGRNRF